MDKYLVIIVILIAASIGFILYVRVSGKINSADKNLNDLADKSKIDNLQADDFSILE